jgi:hypothetical protein
MPGDYGRRGRARRRWIGAERRTAALGEDSETPSRGSRRFGRGAANTALTVGIVPLWVLWVIHASASFWLVAVGMNATALDHHLPALGREPASTRGRGLGHGFRPLRLCLGSISSSRPSCALDGSSVRRRTRDLSALRQKTVDRQRS